MSNVRIIKTFTRDENFPRHSEGDFIRLNDGSIMLVYTRYIGNSHKDAADASLAVTYSYDNGETWTEPKMLLHPSEFNVTNIMSVSLMRMQNGDLGLSFGAAVPGYQKWNNRRLLLRSRDEGKTFYSQTECQPREYHNQFGLNNSRVERLSSGRIILTMHTHPGAKKNTEFPEKLREGAPNPRISKFSFGVISYSDDDGYTWKTAEDLICPPFTDTAKGLQEGGVFEIRPGILKSYWRSDRMYQYESLSFDNGEHWTAPTQSCFTSPWSPMKITRNPYTNKLYAIWNPIPLYNGRPFRHIDWGRTPYVYAEVNEDATKFGEMHVIEGEPDHGYCYPAVLFTAPDEMMIAYCSGGPEEDCGLVKLTISKIKLDNETTEESNK